MNPMIQIQNHLPSIDLDAPVAPETVYSETVTTETATFALG